MVVATQDNVTPSKNDKPSNFKFSTVSYNNLSNAKDFIDLITSLKIEKYPHHKTNS